MMWTDFSDYSTGTATTTSTGSVTYCGTCGKIKEASPPFSGIEWCTCYKNETIKLLGWVLPNQMMELHSLLLILIFLLLRMLKIY